MSKVVSVRLSEYDYETLCRAVADYNRMQPGNGPWPAVRRSDIIYRALMVWLRPWMEADNGQD